MKCRIAFLQVAPVLAIMRQLLTARASGSQSVPSHVKLLWVARHSEEFAVLEEAVAQAAR
jgi:hypothetical protein